MITIDVKDKRGELTGKITPRIMELAQELPGRKRWQGRLLAFQASFLTLDYFRRNVPAEEVTFTPAAQKILGKFDQTREAANQTKESKKIEDAAFLDDPYQYKTKPFNHQAKAFVLSRDLQIFALFMEMGTGKSKVVVDTACYLYEKGLIDKILVIAPNGVHRKWVEEEFPVHFPDRVPFTAWFYTNRMLAAQRRSLDTFLKLERSNSLQVFSMNIEALQGSDKSTAYKFCDMFLSNGRALVVVDESTRIKTHDSARTKNVIRLGQKAEFKRMLSGSPITKGMEDLFSQFRFLDPAIIGCNSFTEFKMNYCLTRKIDPDADDYQVAIVGYKNIDDIQRRIEGFTYRTTKKECLDLPPKIYTPIPIDLSDEQRRIYNLVRDDFIEAIRQRVITDVPHKMTQLLRLQQIICGTYPVEGEEREIEDVPRLRTTIEMIKESQSKVVVWSRFMPSIRRLSAMLKKEQIDFVEYTGEVDQDQRVKNRMEFQRRDGGPHVFIGTQAAGGIGLELTASTTVIYYANSFNAEHRWQSEDRNHRIGVVGEAVNYYDLIAPGTIDRKFIQNIRDKKNIADKVLMDGDAYLMSLLEDGE